MEELDRDEGAGLYGNGPDGYDRGRVQYPDRVYELLATSGVAVGARVVEIGPATGLVTRRLLAAGARVTAVEPNLLLADDLDVRSSSDSLEVVNATFEDAALADGSFDVVVAGTSFHWVDPGVGHARARRILRPGRAFTYWWMLFEDPWHPDSFDAASHRVLGGSPTVPRPGVLPFQVDTDLHTDRLTSAGFENVASEVIRSTHHFDTGQVVDLYATLAIVLRRPPADQQRVLEQLAELVDADYDGEIDRTFVTAIYTGTKPHNETPSTSRD